MRKHAFGVVVLGLALFACAPVRYDGVLPAPPPVRPPASPPSVAPKGLNALNAAFRTAYQDAAKANQEGLPCTAPVIVNDFLNMTLYRCHAEPLRFEMDTRRYFLMARTAHVPLAIYSLIARERFGDLSEAAVGRLQNYEALLRPARTEALALDVDPSSHDRIESLFDASSRYLERVLASRRADLEDYEGYAREVRPLLEGNLRAAAEDQLTQFRTRLDAWKGAYPDDRWSDARVVVMGVHQAREQNLMLQMFRWMLDEDLVQNRVVYAEYQFSPFGDKAEEARSLALQLLSKVDLDHRAAEAIFGDRNALQSDVLGPATATVLESWEKP